MQKTCSWNFRKKINSEGKASIACEWTLRCTSSIHPKNELWSNHLLRIYGSKRASKKLTRTLIFHDRPRPQDEKSFLTTKSVRMRFNFLQIAWIRRSSIVSDGRRQSLGQKHADWREENISSQLHLFGSLAAKWSEEEFKCVWTLKRML